MDEVVNKFSESLYHILNYYDNDNNLEYDNAQLIDYLHIYLNLLIQIISTETDIIHIFMLIRQEFILSSHDFDIIMQSQAISFRIGMMHNYALSEDDKTLIYTLAEYVITGYLEIETYAPIMIDFINQKITIDIIKNVIKYETYEDIISKYDKIITNHTFNVHDNNELIIYFINSVNHNIMHYN